MTLILQLDDSKAPGPSHIPIKILKIAAPIIVPHVVKIINTSFELGVYHNVIPIFKVGSKVEVNNWTHSLKRTMFFNMAKMQKCKNLTIFFHFLTILEVFMKGVYLPCALMTNDHVLGIICLLNKR